MSKPSILDEKIAVVRAERDKALMQVAMYNQMLELLEAPASTAETKEPVQRAKRGSVQASILAALAERPMSIDELENKIIPAVGRSSIRKAFVALGKDNKVLEMSDGKWALKPAPLVTHLHVEPQLSHLRTHAPPQNHAPAPDGDDASVREE